MISEYAKALDLLDGYDHNCISKPIGRDTIYKLDYIECKKIIKSMKFIENLQYLE